MIIQKATVPPGRGSLACSNKLENYQYRSSFSTNSAAPPRPRRMMSSNPLQRTRSARGVRHHEMVAPTDKHLRRKHGNREMVRRALTPPPRRMNLRWLNFRPTPSRLSNMSTAAHNS